MSWQGFSDEAKKVVFKSIENNNGGPAFAVDLLIACLESNDKVLNIILQRLGVKKADIVSYLNTFSITELRDPNRVLKDSELSDCAKQCLNRAQDEKRNLGGEQLEVIFIFIGVLRYDDLAYIKKLSSVISVNAIRGAYKELAFSLTNSSSNTKAVTDTLETYGINLNKLASAGKIDPVIGRNSEVDRVTKILSRRNKSNPCLIGDAGVGKTAIAEALALNIINERAPSNLLDCTIYSLNISNLVSGTRFRGDFEERLNKILQEAVQSNGKVILFIDEIHTVVGSGSSDGALDTANILKPYLSRGDLRVIGATTNAEYRTIEKDKALARRFQPIRVEEPTPELTIEILKGIRYKYELFHKVNVSNKAIFRVYVSDEVIQYAVQLASRYLTERYFPDKALDLIDEACANVRVNYQNWSPEVLGLFREMDALTLDTNHHKLFQNNQEIYKNDIAIKEIEEKITATLEKEKTEVKEITRLVLTKKDLEQVLEKWTGIPVSQLETEDRSKLKNMEADLQSKIIGQNHAVKIVTDAIKRNRTGLKDPKRPVASFIFLGPTGVGKSELSKVLAEYLYGTPNALIQVDMSEYEQAHTVARMVGSPPGYVGFGQGGQLTEKVRKAPYSIILFDEIEKAHPDIFNIFLQILEDGQLTDGQGNRVDFRNTTIIMTSNLGIKPAESSSVGFRDVISTNTAEAQANARDRSIQKALKESFKPEFLNRIDDVIIFNSLTKENLYQIIDIYVSNINKRLEENNIVVTLSNKLKDYLISKGYDVNLGARPLKRVVQKTIENYLADQILNEKIFNGKKYLLSLDRTSNITHKELNEKEGN